MKRVFQKNALGEIPVGQLKGYLGTVNEIAEASAKNKDINTEDYALQLARIAGNVSLAGEIKATLDANQRLLKVKRDELSLMAAMSEIERGRSKFSEIEVRQEEAKLSLIQQQFDIEQKRISNAKTLSDLAFDIELEDARAAAIGGGQSSKLSLADKERDIGQRRIDANEKFDTEALTKSFQKTIIDTFNQAGLNLNQGQIDSVKVSSTDAQFQAYINGFNEQFKEQQKKEIEAAAKVQEDNQRIVSERKLDNLNFKFATEDYDAATRNFTAGVSRFVEILTSPAKFLKSLVSGDSAEEQGGNQNQAAPSAANSTVADSSREAGRAELRKQIEDQRDAVIKKINDDAQKLKDGITGVTIDVQSFRSGILEIERGVELAGKRLQNTFDETGASATTFSNLLRDVFNKIPEEKAKNLFDISTTADPDTLQRAALDQARIGVLENAEGSLADRNKQASEYVLLKEKEIALISASDTATRIQLEYEYQINLQILELRQQIAEAGNTDEAAELAKEIERLKDKKNNPDPGTKLKKLGIDGEEASERMIDAAIEGADRFINTISDGLVDAISKGESLGDVLRGAADDFLDTMAKQAVNNVIRQGLGLLIPSSVGMAEGGMVSGGSGMKDDVPAVLMGGEYVMKKTAVQKYGPNFMNQLNNGTLPGYAEGGMVQNFRTNSGVLASNWTPRSDDDNVDIDDRSPKRNIKTRSGTKASTWTPSSGLDKAKDSEYQDESNKRNQSGVISSDWTKKANLPNILRFEEKTSPLSRYQEYRMSQDEEARKRSDVLSSGWSPKSRTKDEEDKDSGSSQEVQNFADGGMVKSFRAMSGAIASRWTPRSDNDNVDLEDKIPDRKMRTKSGTAASLWTKLSGLDKLKDSEFKDEKDNRTNSGIQSSNWTSKANLPDVLKMAIGGMISGGSGMKDDVPALLMGGEYVMKKSAVQKYGPNFMDKLNGGKLPGYAQGGLVSEAPRTKSGVRSSSWTTEADQDNVSESSKAPNRNVRTESGILASDWTRLANYTKSQKTELTPNLSERNESGLQSSRWTPKADKSTEIDVATGRSRYAPSVVKSEQKSERTESGVEPSRWTKEADYTKVNNVARATKENYRAESGLEVSRWVKESSFDKAVDKKDSSEALFRANSGLITSDWTREASINKASGNTAKTSLQQTIDGRLKQYTEKSVPKNIDKTSNLNKDAVPSMLTSGEYVVGKKAAEKFGKGFLDSLNQGKVQKFAKGGLVSGATFAQEEEDYKTTDIFGNQIKQGSLRNQRGGGDFVLPGLYGEGNITGGQNLLDYSTQAFTSGSRDVVGGLAGASVIALEPESIRLTNFGRTRETPLQAATREAKGQAFDLNLEYQQQIADYKQLLEDIKEEEKARKKAIITKALISIAGMGISAGLSGIGAAMGSGGATSIGQGFLRGAPGSSGSGNNVGGLLNPASYGGGTGFNVGRKNYATGGYVTGESSDVDSVMAMLSGGEFVLNKAATERIGQENLQNLNSGGDTQNSEKIVDKLEQLLLATRENSGEINITVNGGGGNSGGSQSSSQEGTGGSSVEKKGLSGDSRVREELGKTIKLKVLEVLREEKRLGGTLR